MLTRMLFALALVNVGASAETSAPKKTEVKYLVTYDEETDPHLVAIDLSKRVTKYRIVDKTIVASGSATMLPVYPELLSALVNLDVVERVELDGFTIFVHKARICNWDEVEPIIMAIIKDIVAPKAEWREMVSKYPLKAEKMVTELNATPPQ